MTRFAIALAVLIVVLAAGVALAVGGRRHSGSTVQPSVAVNARAPDGVRIRVQVLNGTKVRGLARRATMLLRDRGFDVVEIGTIKDARDTTLVLDLSGHPDWAARVARVFVPARVVVRPDTSRYLDVAVVLGTTWRPPTEPFYP